MGGIASEIKGIEDLAKSLFATFVGTFGVREIIAYGSELERLEKGFEFVAGGAAQAGMQLDFIHSVAGETGKEFIPLAESFKAMQAAAEGTSIKGKALQDTFEGIVQYGSAMRLSTDNIVKALSGMTAILDRGTISSMDLRRVFRELPGSVGVLADAYDVSTQKLMLMAQQGKLVAEDALPKLGRALSAKSADSALGAAQEFHGEVAALKNEMQGVASAIWNAGLETTATWFAVRFKDMATAVKDLINEGMELAKTTFAPAATPGAVVRHPIPAPEPGTEALPQLSVNQLREIDSLIKGGTPAVEKYQEQWTLLDRALKSGAISTKEYWEGVTKATETYHKAADQSPIIPDKTGSTMELKLTEMRKKFDQFGYDLQIDVAKDAGQYLEAEMLQIDKKATTGIDEVWKNIQQQQASYEGLTTKFEIGKVPQEEWAAAAGALAESWKTGLDTIDVITEDRFTKISGFKGLIKTFYAEAGVSVANLKMEYAGLTGSVYDQLEAQKQYIEVTARRNILDAKTPEIAQWYRDLADAQEHLLDMRATGTQFQGMVYGMDEWRRTMATNFDVGKQSIDAFKSGIESAASALAEFTVTGKMNFSDFATSLVKDFLKIQYQALLTKALLGTTEGGGIFGWLKGLLPGVGGGAAVAGAGTAGSIAPTLGTPLTLIGGMMQSGGPVYGGQAYIVGEKRPEIFLPRTSGTILPSTSAPSLVVNVKNETGSKVQADQSAPRWDGEKYVGQVNLKLLKNDSNYRSSMKQLLTGG